MDTLVYERIKLTSRRIWKEIHDLQEYKAKKGLCTLGLFCGSPVMGSDSEPGTGWHYKETHGCAHHVAALKSGVKLRKLDGYVTEYAKIRQRETEREREAAAEKQRIEADKDKAREKLKKSSAA